MRTHFREGHMSKFIFLLIVLGINSRALAQEWWIWESKERGCIPAQSADVNMAPSKLFKYMPGCRLVENQAYNNIGLELVWCKELGFFLYAHSLEACRKIPSEMKNIERQLKAMKNQTL